MHRGSNCHSWNHDTSEHRVFFVSPSEPLLHKELHILRIRGPCRHHVNWGTLAIMNFMVTFHLLWSCTQAVNTNQYHIYCSAISMLQTGIGVMRLKGRDRKCPVPMWPGSTSGNDTICAQRAVPTERNTVAARNVVYQDFIHCSLRM